MIGWRCCGLGSWRTWRRRRLFNRRGRFRRLFEWTRVLLLDHSPSAQQLEQAPFFCRRLWIPDLGADLDQVLAPGEDILREDVGLTDPALPARARGHRPSRPIIPEKGRAQLINAGKSSCAASTPSSRGSIGAPSLAM
jgi:hypothetical protein